jgi:hypothetical protein
MAKRAQLTLFILLGLMIVAAALVYYFMSSRDSSSGLERLIEAPAEIQPLKLFVESCISEQLQQAVKDLPLQGGYYERPPLSTTYSGLTIPYYYHHEALSQMPSEQVLGNQIALFLEDRLPDCIQDFRALRQGGFDIDAGELSASALLAQGSVDAEISYPLRVRRNDFSYTIDRFSASVDSTFRQMYGYAEGIIAELEKNPQYMPISFLIELASDNGFTVETILQDEGSVIYTLNDVDALREPRIFAFAVKYDWDEGSTEFEIDRIPDQTAYVGYAFSYDVTATLGGATFSDYTDLFNIDADTGQIKFIPMADQLGFYRILIRAEDPEGNAAQAMMTLEIKSDNQAPSIDPISDKTIRVGDVFSYTVHASDPEDDQLFYHVETDLSGVFLNLMDGELTYTPTSSDIGPHDVVIRVLDIHNPPVEQGFILTVVP